MACYFRAVISLTFNRRLTSLSYGDLRKAKWLAFCNRGAIRIIVRSRAPCSTRCIADLPSLGGLEEVGSLSNGRGSRYKGKTGFDHFSGKSSGFLPRSSIVFQS